MESLFKTLRLGFGGHSLGEHEVSGWYSSGLDGYRFRLIKVGDLEARYWQMLRRFEKLLKVQAASSLDCFDLNAVICWAFCYFCSSNRFVYGECNCPN